MAAISTVYISELCRMIGIEQFNNCSLILFAYVSGICVNLSTNWVHTTCSVIGSQVYYFLRLGIHFHDFPVSLIAICAVCCCFYVVNIIVFEVSQKQDKVFINKFSNLSLSM